MRISIRYQILGLVSLVVIGAMSAYAVYATQLITTDKLAYVYDLNTSLARTRSEEVQATLGALVDKLRYFDLQIAGLDPARERTDIDDKARLLLLSDPDVVALELWHEQRGKRALLYETVDEANLAPLGLESADLPEIRGAHPISLRRVLVDGVQVKNTSLASDTLLHALAIASDVDGRVLVARLNASRLLRLFTNSTLYDVFLIDGDGDLVVHSDPARLGAHERVLDLPIVRTAIDGAGDRGAQEYTREGDGDAREMLGAFSRVGLGRLTVITEIHMGQALASTDALVRRTVLVAIAVVLASFLIGISLSRRISGPLNQLEGLVTEIAHGDFGRTVAVKASGEVGSLAEAFNRMSGALAERERRLSKAHDIISHFGEELVFRIAKVSEHRDEDTGAHIQRVSLLSALLAREAGLSPERVENIRLASPLHDVGKVGIPDRILLKPGALSETELEEMRTHTRGGHTMLSGSDSPILDLAASIALTHHERWDGSGYPEGLAGTDIPIEGRIVAVADVFDALTNARPYKGAMGVVAAAETIEAASGGQFDPTLVDILLTNLDRCVEIQALFSEQEGEVRDGSRRVASRVPCRRYRVYFGPREHTRLGFIKNMSRQGMAIACKEPLQAGALVRARIETDDGALSLAGLVKWTSRSSVPGSFASADMGIEVSDTDGRYDFFHDQVISAFNEGRQSLRIDKVLTVSFTSASEAVHEYTQNISLGGLFVVTSVPPEPETVVDVELSMPDAAAPLRARAVVMHAVTAAQASKLGLNPGAGLQFLQFRGEDEERMRAFIESQRG